MELLGGYFVSLLFLFHSVEKISALNTTEKFQIIMPEEPPILEKISPAQNKTIDKLVQEQTDLIKKIVSDHKATTVDYPVVTRKEAEVKEDAKLKEEKERQSIEELRRRCQELFKLTADNITQKIEERSETKESIDRISTVEAFGPNKKPEFLQKKKEEVSQTPKLPSNFSNPSQVEEMTKNYFFITRNQTTINNRTVPVNDTQQPSAVGITKSQNLISQNIQRPLHENVKYVQLEPVILQKMILNNGRMLFYWYKNIPIMPQFVSVPKYQTHPPRVSDVPAYPTFRYPSQISNIPANPSQVLYQTQALNNQFSQSQTYPSQILGSQKSQISNTQSEISKNASQILNTLKYPSQISNTPSQFSNTQKYSSQFSNTQSQFSNTQSQFSNTQSQIPNMPSQISNTQKYSSQIPNTPLQISNIQNYPSQTHPSQYTNTQNYQSQISNSQTAKTQPIRPQTPPEQVPNYEIEYGATEKSDDALYRKQMKFVIPLPYPAGAGGDEIETPTRYPWQFDPYAYYPRSLQPSTINVPLPYLPTFHMIRTLRLPENFVKTGNAKSSENY